jgi:acyl dehydratase
MTVARGTERRLSAAGELGVGSVLRVNRTFTGEDLTRFGELTRDYNPVHYEPRWCAQRGYSGLICHGLLVGSMLCEPGGQAGWLATGMSFRFRRPVYPGDTITCEMTITELEDSGRARAECVYWNQRGEEVITAELEGYLPGPAERELLAQMLEEGDPTNGLGGP